MIDYKIISNSIDFYSDRGFKRIESPWAVTKAVSDITRPLGAEDFQLVKNQKVLVASGEQSFLYLYLKGFLPKGKFQTVTPCFRNEEFDATHTKYFIKNELIITENISSNRLDAIVSIALDFFERYLPCEVVKTSDSSFDLCHRGIELGSYGIRRCDYLEWIYGTGVAEPRFSSTMFKYGISY